ncbi:hypothetical protein MO973_10925 [Paenibacillus sp. TRM 82003]|nr:hypothetical protein [Paenibacillus sp. TRM 82003]
MRKSWKGMLYSVIAASTVVAGCGNTAGNPEEQPPGAVESNPSTAQGESGNTAGGQTRPVVILMSEPRESNPEDIEKVEKYIEEQSGVEIEVKNVRATSEEDYKQSVNVNLAAGGIDVILVNNKAMYTQLVQNGAVQSINEPLQQYGADLMKQYSEEAWKAVSDTKGNIYGLPRQSILASDTIAVRKDWRERLGMEPITTLEQFESYLRAVHSADLDGNGAADTIPLLSNTADYSALDKTLLYVFTENSPFHNEIDASGNIVPNYTNPQYKAYLDTLSRWNKEELLYPGIVSIKKNIAEDLIISNRVGAYAAWYSDYIRPLEKLRATVPDADYEYITLQTLNGNPYKFYHKDPYGQRAVFVKGSDNVAHAVKLFNWMMAAPENYFSTKWGIHGEYWKFADESKGTVIRLKGKENPTNSYNYAFSMMFYGPWDFRGDDPDFVNSRYYAAWDYFSENQKSFIKEPDWFMNYDLKGTDVEISQQDAETLMMENRTKIILNHSPVDSWDQTMEEYANIYGKAYSEIATKQYNDFLANNQ